MPLAATAFPSDVACAIALGDAATLDLGNPRPGLPLTSTAQARQPDYRRKASSSALNSGTDLSQPPRPVRVILRRHPPACSRTRQTALFCGINTTLGDGGVRENARRTADLGGFDVKRAYERGRPDRGVRRARGCNRTWRIRGAGRRQPIPVADLARA